MSSQAIQDYLEKKLLIDKEIVTFRLLSREQGLHVNAAKNELAQYLQACSTRDAVTPTYFLSGLAKPPPPQYSQDTQEDVNMDEELEDNDGYADPEDDTVPRFKVLLAGEKDFQAAESQFEDLQTMYIYSLSPAPIRDADHLYAATQAVRQLDLKKDALPATTFGKVVGSDVLLRKGGKVTNPLLSLSRGKGKATPNAESTTASEQKPKLPSKTNEKPTPAAAASTSKPAKTGKLDFSKAKPKAEKKVAEAPVKAKKEVKKPVETAASESEAEPKPKTATVSKKTAAPKVESKKASLKRKSPEDSEAEPEPTKMTSKPKPSNKRKSALMSDDSEDETTDSKPAKATVKDTSKAKVKKGALLSDDEDEDEAPIRQPARRRGKARAMDPDLDDMMALDDNEVERVQRPSHPSKKPVERDEDEDEDLPPPEEDINMKEEDDEDTVEPLPKKKPKVKKAVPIGSNGLKKRKVTKSRMFTNEKGFMVTEDYSEYESVDEEELEPTPKPKGKAKLKKAAPDAEPAKPKKTPATKTSESTSTSKGAKASAGKGNIASFFGKKA